MSRNIFGNEPRQIPAGTVVMKSPFGDVVGFPKLLSLPPKMIEKNKKPAKRHSDLWELIAKTESWIDLSCRELAKITGYSKSTCHRVQYEARKAAYPDGYCFGYKSIISDLGQDAGQL
jgi:hypothetical protein